MAGEALKELFFRLGLKVDGQSFDKADSLVSKLKSGFGAIAGLLGGISVLGIGAFIKRIADQADTVGDLSQSLGVGTQELQKLGYAAEQNGIIFESLTVGIRQLARSVFAAKDGSKESQKAFAQLGVTLSDDVNDVLLQVAERFKNMPDNVDKTALSMRLFGRSGADMVPFLNKGREGIEALGQEAQDLGIVFDDVLIQSNFADDIGALMAGIKGLGITAIAPLIPTLKEVVVNMVAWIKANRALMGQRLDKVLAVVGVFVNVAWFALSKLGAVLGFVIDHWQTFAAFLTGVGLAALLLNTGGVTTLAGAYLLAGKAALVAGARAALAWVGAAAPLIAIAAGLTLAILLIEDISSALKGEDSLLARWFGKDFIERVRKWKDQFAEFWDFLKQGFSLTWDDIKKGFKEIFDIESPNTPKEETTTEGIGRRLKGLSRIATAPARAVGLFPDLEQEFREQDDKAKAEAARALPEPQISVPSIMFESPTQSTSESSSGPTSFNVQMNVYPSPGQSERAIGEEASRQIKAWYEGELQQARSAVG